MTDTFQLTPDTTLPVVTAVTPSGLTNANVSSLSVTFNKAINPSTFTSGEVTISGPARGDPEQLDHDHGSRCRTLHDRDSDSDAGGDVQRQHRRAGRCSTFPATRWRRPTRRASPSITPCLSVVSVSPTGTVNDVVDHIDVTFNKAMNTSTLNGSNITLTGPGGAVTVGQGYLVSGDTYRIPIAAAAGQRLVPAHDRNGGAGSGGNAAGQCGSGFIHGVAAGPGRRPVQPSVGTATVRLRAFRGVDSHEPGHRRGDRAVDG